MEILLPFGRYYSGKVENWIHSICRTLVVNKYEPVNNVPKVRSLVDIVT